MKKSLLVIFLAILFIPGLVLARTSPDRGTKDLIPFEPDDTLEEIRYKIDHNGYTFEVSDNWVYDLPPAEKDRIFSRFFPLRPMPKANEDPGPLAEIVGRKQLPSSFDWRNYNGHSYIGPIKDQGSCGSCYSFGANAAAEGTYNVAMGLYDGNCANFSESYIIWCLGRLAAYSSHFYGCDGADYDYAELSALCEVGVTTQANFPYQENDPGSCTHWNDQTVAFQSWHRIGCNDIEAIKTAIMTYGVIDVAVYASSAFSAYDNGIYEDTNTTCSASPCYYTNTNHAVALVGWDDNPPEGGGGVWILRNSWGTSWGESGYMRIRFTSAVVACECCYLVYNAPIHDMVEEGFDDFNIGTRPLGWTFTGCDQNTDTYTDPGYYGQALPSLKLDQTGDQAVSISFSSPDSLSFWCRGVGTNPSSSLLVEEYYGTWHSLSDISPLPTSGTTIGPIDLYSQTSRVRFTYSKDAGELAFDDVLIRGTGDISPPPTPTPSATPDGYKTPVPTSTATPAPTPSPLPAGLLLQENFEGEWPGWTEEAISGTENWWQAEGSGDPTGLPPSAYQGTYNALFYFDDYETKSTRLISPSIDFGSYTNNPTLSFWHTQGSWEGDFDTMSVYYRTSQAGAWQLLQSYNSAVDTWTERTISLPATSSDFYICFVPSTNYGWGVCIDMVEVTGDASGSTTTTGSTTNTSTTVVTTTTTSTSTTTAVVPSNSVVGDYNGDGTTDLAVYRQSAGLWKIRNISNIYFGTSVDEPVPQDYDGDGAWDVAYFRPSNGLWKVRNITRIYFGNSTDQMVPGDYDGNGTAEPAYFRPSTTLWNVRNQTRIYFGTSSDIPIPNDYNGDGAVDPTFYRGSNGLWKVRNVTSVYFGTATDTLVPADYNGDGTVDFAWFRPSNNLWKVKDLTRIYYGTSSDTVFAGDFDGDGTADLGYFRPSSILWKIKDVTRVYFGQSGDTQVSNPYTK